MQRHSPSHMRTHFAAATSKSSTLSSPRGGIESCGDLRPASRSLFSCGSMELACSTSYSLPQREGRHWKEAGRVQGLLQHQRLTATKTARKTVNVYSGLGCILSVTTASGVDEKSASKLIDSAPARTSSVVHSGVETIGRHWVRTPNSVAVPPDHV